VAFLVPVWLRQLGLAPLLPASQALLWRLGSPVRANRRYPQNHRCCRGDGRRLVLAQGPVRRRYLGDRRRLTRHQDQRYYCLARCHLYRLLLLVAGRHQDRRRPPGC